MHENLIMYTPVGPVWLIFLKKLLKTFHFGRGLGSGASLNSQLEGALYKFHRKSEVNTDAIYNRIYNEWGWNPYIHVWYIGTHNILCIYIYIY